MADLRSVLFVSTSLIPPDDERREIDSILAKGTARNASLAVTGSLLFTHKHFAEVLEGEWAVLEDLLGMIRQDPRHCGMRIIDVLQISEPIYTRWAMAYHGPSAYVSRRVAPLISDPSAHIARELRAFMRCMAEDGT